MQSTPKNKTQSNLHLIPQVQNYKNLHEPLLSQQKTTSIQQKLMLQKQAVQYTRQQQTNLQYYIKYNYNPFLQYKGQQAQIITSLIRSKNDQVVNIVNKLTEIDKQTNTKKLQQKIDKIQSNPNNMRNMMKSFQLFSNKLLNNIQKEQIQNQNQGSAQTSKSPLKTLFAKPTQAVMQQVRPRQFTQFHLAKQGIQSIAAVKQQNYFLKNMKKVNIFKIARGEDQDLSSRQLLKKYHFCNNSIVQKISKIKFPIYRDISTLGRKVIMGQTTQNQNIIDFVDSYQLSFKMKQLLYHDIMSIASNRFSADFLYRLMNFDQTAMKQVSDTASQQKQQPQIIYKKNQQNMQFNFVNQNEQIQQIKDYKLLKSNQIQKIHENKYNLQLEYIQKKLQLRKYLNKNTVKDQQLHSKIQGDIKYTFQNLLQLDQKKIEPDRLIRINKITKNRSQVLKMKTIMEALANKNRQDLLLAGQQNTRDRSKSNNKSANKSNTKSNNKSTSKSITKNHNKSITNNHNQSVGMNTTLNKSIGKNSNNKHSVSTNIWR